MPENDCEKNYLDYQNIKLELIEQLAQITHQFTHFTLIIFPIYLRAKNILKKMDLEKMIWYNLSSKLPGGVAAPVSKILLELKKYEPHYSLSEIGN